MKDSNFYVYLHKKATDGSVFYIGKGNGNRSGNKSHRSDYWKRIVAKHGYTIEFVERDIQEWYAFELETSLIAYYGRENTCNMTDGGEGTSGRVVSDETKLKISKAQSGCLGNNFGKKQSDDYKKKMSIFMSGENGPCFGKKASEETRLKQSLAKRGELHHNFGKKRSEVTCKKISDAQKGRKMSDEQKKSISIAKKGKFTEKNRIQLASIRRSGSENNKSRKTKCLDNGMIFDCVTHAVGWLKSIGVKTAAQPNISNCAIGKRRIAYGFQWAYI